VVRFHEAEFSPALATYLVALSDAAREQGYAVMLLTEADGAEAVRRAISGRQVDGLILLNVLDGDPRLEPIGQAGFPAVLVGMPEDTRGIDAVDLDFGAAGAMLVDHLVDAGHREAMFVRWPEELYLSGSTYATRFERSAYRRAAERGLRLVPVPVPVGPEQVRETLGAALQDPANPRTLLIHNDAAVAMLPFVLRDLGLEVPADRSVVSLHSAELARLYVLSYTAVESDPAAVAQTAVELLCKRIAEPHAPVQRQLVTPRLDRRSSVKTLA
jgi:DNA-binding LacI/PurR family transcriptional regulator